MTSQATTSPKAISKLPPHSLEAERAVLGGLMLDANAWDRLSGRLAEADFYQGNHRAIFASIVGLVQRDVPVDVLTVAESLKANSEINQQDIETYLFELANSVMTAGNIAAYADIVRERSVLRQLIGSANTIAESAYTYQGDDVAGLLDQAEQKIFNISNQGSERQEPKKIADFLAQASDKIDTLYHSDHAITGTPTGFADLDEMTSGMQPGDLVVVAGRPSMGKTVLAMNIAETAAIGAKEPVLVFSLEMPGDALAMRCMSSLGRVCQHRLRTGKLTDDDWPRVASSIGMLSESSIFIDDTPALSPADMRARARRVAREHGQLKLIVIDYLQLMQIPGARENRTLEISEISRSLKALAKELNVPVIALSQLNRGLEQRPDKRPMMSDLRESGAIEQDADLILFIYRDEVYHPDSPYKGTAEIIVAKQRNGPIGKVRLTFLGQYVKFENYTNNEYISDVPHGMD
jgi:replicative DNA helicase